MQAHQRRSLSTTNLGRVGEAMKKWIILGCIAAACATNYMWSIDYNEKTTYAPVRFPCYWRYESDDRQWHVQDFYEIVRQRQQDEWIACQHYLKILMLPIVYEIQPSATISENQVETLRSNFRELITSNSRLGELPHAEFISYVHKLFKEIYQLYRSNFSTSRVIVDLQGRCTLRQVSYNSSNPMLDRDARMRLVEIAIYDAEKTVGSFTKQMVSYHLLCKQLAQKRSKSEPSSPASTSDDSFFPLPYTTPHAEEVAKERSKVLNRLLNEQFGSLRAEDPWRNRIVYSDGYFIGSYGAYNK